jgi:hypothetical protein
MTPGGFAGLAVLSGTVALAGLGAAGLGTLSAPQIDNTATTIVERRPAPSEPAVVTASIPVGGESRRDANLSEPVFALASSSEMPAAEVPAVEVPAVELPAVEAVLPDAPPPRPPETSVQIASALPYGPVDDERKPTARPIELPTECVTDICIDEYLWSLYERTPKIDTIKVTERIKVTVKKKGKTRTVTKTNVKYVVDDFTWKDPAAAQKAGMSLKDYVIGGMDRGFRLKLYGALRAMDDAGFMPGITSAFRDDYRQSLASGNKAATDRSYHGGTLRGGYGHGRAADLVSVKGETRMERFAVSEELWKWIDAHEKELGVGRPYLDRDPPHVGAIDGGEYADKRGRAKVQTAGLQRKDAGKTRLDTTKRQLAARNDAAAKPAKPAKSPKVSSLQKRPTAQR